MYVLQANLPQPFGNNKIIDYGDPLFYFVAKTGAGLALNMHI